MDVKMGNHWTTSRMCLHFYTKQTQFSFFERRCQFMKMIMTYALFLQVYILVLIKILSFLFLPAPSDLYN